MDGYDELPDEAIVCRMREGDEDATAALLERYLPLLRRRVRERLPAVLRRKVAESDVIQDAYVSALRRLAAFDDRGPGSFGAWIRTIVDRRLADQVRRFMAAGKRDVNREITAAEEGARPQPAAGGVSVGARVQRTEAVRGVHDALGRLASQDRQVVELVHFKGLTIAEVADVVGTTRDAARMRYARALRRLRERLGESGAERTA